MSEGNYYQDAIQAIERAEYWHQETKRELVATRESQQVFHASLNRALGYTVGGPTAPCEFLEEIAVLRQRHLLNMDHALSLDIISDGAKQTARIAELEAERDRQQDRAILAESDARVLRQRDTKLRQALRTIIAERARNLEATCPGEHDYEPDCTHGVNHCPIIATAKAALVAKP